MLSMEKFRMNLLIVYKFIKKNELQKKAPLKMRGFWISFAGKDRFYRVLTVEPCRLLLNAGLIRFGGGLSNLI